MSKEVRCRVFEPRQSLKDAGITNIIAEFGEGIAKTIFVEHANNGEPIIISLDTKVWYGDARENFKTTAAQYFDSEVVLQLDREIGSVYMR